MSVDNGTTRTFSSGATRDTAQDKLDYEGFLSPMALERFAQYMHKNRLMADGTVRDSDNWQKGIPRTVYMKSLWRHLKELWSIHRAPRLGVDMETEEALCGIIFNAQGYLHEHLKASKSPKDMSKPLAGIEAIRRRLSERLKSDFGQLRWGPERRRRVSIFGGLALPEPVVKICPYCGYALGDWEHQCHGAGQEKCL